MLCGMPFALSANPGCLPGSSAVKSVPTDDLVPGNDLFLWNEKGFWGFCVVLWGFRDFAIRRLL